MAERSVIFEVKLEQGQLLQALAKDQEALRKLKEEQKELDKARKDGTKSAEDVAKRTAEISVEQDRTRRSIAETKKEMRLLDTQQKANEGSIVAMRAQLSQLNKEYDNLSKEQRDNADIGGKLQQQIAGLTDELKELEGATGRNQRNVGNYDAAVQKLAGSLNIMGVNVGDAISSAKELGGTIKDLIKSVGAQIAAQEANTAATLTNTTATGANTVATEAGTVATNANTTAVNLATRSLKFLKIALISIGIGAIVVVLGTLVAAFLSTQEGIDKVTKVLQPLQVGFARIIGFVQNTAISVFEGFGKAISNPKQAFVDLGNVIKDNITNRITGLIKLVKSAVGIFAELPKALVTGEFDKVKENLEGVADGVIAVGTGVEDGVKKLKGAAQGFNDTLSDIGTDAQRLNAIYDRLNELNRTQASRLAELNVQLQDNQLIARDQTKSLEERENALTLVNDAIEKQYQAEAELLELQIEQLEIKQKQNKTDQTELEQLDKLRSELIQLKARRSQQKRETLEIENQLRNLNKQYGANIGSIKTLETSISKLKDAQSNLVIGTKEASDEYQKLGKQIDDIQRKIDLFKAGLDDIDLDTELTLTLSDAKAIEFTKDEKDKAQKELDDFVGSLKVDPKNLQLPDADTNPLYNAFGVTDEQLDQFTERLNSAVGTYTNFSNQLSSLIDQSAKVRVDNINKEADAQVKAIEKSTLSEEEKAQKIAEIQEKAQKKSEQIQKKNAKAQQKLQIAQTIATTAQAAVNIYNSVASTGGPAAPILAAIAAAATAAFGAAQVGIIASQKFAKGGIAFPSDTGGFIHGPSHANGGVPFRYARGGMAEAEGGEIILTKGVSKSPKLMSMASQINAAAGGVDFYKGYRTGGLVYAAGGQVRAEAELQRTVRKVAETPIVVSVRDILTGTERVTSVEQDATIG